MDSLGEWDFRPDLKSLSVPVLVVEGAETAVPLDGTREWVSNTGDARLLLIPRAGHMNWLDQPAAVVLALDQFFRGQWPPAAAR